MWEIIQSGGPMMVPLIACAILAIAYSIETPVDLQSIALAGRSPK